MSKIINVYTASQKSRNKNASTDTTASTTTTVTNSNKNTNAYKNKKATVTTAAKQASTANTSSSTKKLGTYATKKNTATTAAKTSDTAKASNSASNASKVTGKFAEKKVTTNAASKLKSTSATNTKTTFPTKSSSLRNSGTATYKNTLMSKGTSDETPTLPKRTVNTKDTSKTDDAKTTDTTTEKVKPSETSTALAEATQKKAEDKSTDTTTGNGKTVLNTTLNQYVNGITNAQASTKYTGSSADDVLNALASLAGEGDNGNNTTINNYFNASGQPYCGYALLYADAVTGAGILSGVENAAYVPSIKEGLADKQVANSDVQKGDIFAYGDDHVGFVYDVLDDGTVITIEGNSLVYNSADAAAGSSIDSGSYEGIGYKHRTLDSNYTVYRPDYGTGTTTVSNILTPSQKSQIKNSGGILSTGTSQKGSVNGVSSGNATTTTGSTASISSYLTPSQQSRANAEEAEDTEKLIRQYSLFGEYDDEGNFTAYTEDDYLTLLHNYETTQRNAAKGDMDAKEDLQFMEENGIKEMLQYYESEKEARQYYGSDIYGLSADEAQSVIQGLQNQRTSVQAEQDRQGGQEAKLEELNQRIQRGQEYIASLKSTEELREEYISNLEASQEAKKAYTKAENAYSKLYDLYIIRRGGEMSEKEEEKLAAAKAEMEQAKAAYDDAESATAATQSQWTTRSQSEYDDLTEEELQDIIDGNSDRLKLFNFDDRPTQTERTLIKKERTLAEAALKEKELSDYEEEITSRDDYNTQYADAYADRIAGAKEMSKAANAYGNTNAGLNFSEDVVASATDEERDIYNYLYSVEGPDAAQEYYNKIASRLNERGAEAVSQYAEDFTTGALNGRETNDAGKAVASTVASLVSVATQIAGAPAVVADAVASVTSGFSRDAIDPNAMYQLNTQLTTDIRQSVSDQIRQESINKKTEQALINLANATTEEEVAQAQFELEQASSAGSFSAWMYDTAMSIADFTTNMLVFGNAAVAVNASAKAVATIMSIVLGSEVASQTVIESIQNGYNSNEALAQGVIAGLIEGISEKYSIQYILKDSGSALKNLAKSFISESTEEVAANWMNRVVDIVSHGDANEMKTEYYSYINEGYTPDEALTKLVYSLLKEDGSSFLAGGIAAIGSSGSIRTAIGTAYYNDHAQSLTTIADAMPEGSVAKEKANALKTKAASAKSYSEAYDNPRQLKTDLDELTDAIRADSGAAEAMKTLQANNTDGVNDKAIKVLSGIMKGTYNVANDKVIQMMSYDSKMTASKAQANLTAIEQAITTDFDTAMELVENGSIDIQNDAVAVTLYDMASAMGGTVSENSADSAYTADAIFSQSRKTAKTVRPAQVRNLFKTMYENRATVEAAHAEYTAKSEAAAENLKQEYAAAVQNQAQVIAAREEITSGAEQAQAEQSTSRRIKFGSETERAADTSMAEFMADYAQRNPKATIREIREVAERAYHHSEKLGPLPGTAPHMSAEEVERVLSEAMERSAMDYALKIASGRMKLNQVEPELQEEVKALLKSVQDERAKITSETNKNLDEAEYIEGSQGTVTYKGDMSHKGQPLRGVTDEEFENANKDQRFTVKAMSKLAPKLGIRVVFFKGDGNTPFWAENVGGTRTVYVDWNAKQSVLTGKTFTRFSLSHELVHRLSLDSPAQYKKLRDTVVAKLGGEEELKKLIDLEAGHDEEEVVAEACEELFGATARSMIAEMNSRKLAAAVYRGIEKASTKFKEAIGLPGEWGALSDEAKLTRRHISDLAKAYKNAFTAAYGAIDGFAKNNIDAAAADAVAEDVSTEVVPVEETTRNSVKSLATAAGFVAEKDINGIIILRKGLKKVTTVTVEDIDNSPIGALINYSLEKGYISQAVADSEKKLFADICTMAARSNDFAMAMQFAGSSIFTAIKSNSDAQYNTTYDFPSICTKTQAVIDNMSKTMKRVKRGLTKEEILYAYQEVHYDGNPVPCPECYVFSRWVGIGGLLENLWTYQNKYDGLTKEEVQAQYLEMEKQVREIAEENDLTFGKAKGKLAKKFTDRYTELDEKVSKARNQGEKVSEKDLKDLEIFKSNLDLVKSMTWIDTVYFKNSEHTQVNPRSKWYVPSDILFDLNEGEQFANKYPDAWAFRTTQGAGYGKAITPYAEAVLGEGIYGTNSINGTIKKKKAGEFENIFLDQKGTLDAKARKILENAIRKQNNQAFLGGQRFQSTSDARIENTFDYLVAALEVQAMNGMVQVYTKVPGAVPTFATWGFATNQSLMPKGSGLDENGVPIDTTTGGMNPEIARENRLKFPTQGTITIGVNDNHIRAMFLQTWRDFIIPYHASGGDAGLVSAFRAVQDNGGVDAIRSTDYTRTQKDKVLSDEVLHNYYGYSDEEIALIHARRKARLDIFSMNRTDRYKRQPDMEVVRGSKFLSELYDRLSEDGEWAGVFETKDVVEDTIFPNEFWDASKTYEESGAITQDYLDYCKELGFLHRFSGMVPSNGTLTRINGYDEHGNKVKLTDLAYKEDGTIEDFFWKVLTDHRMYDNEGKYIPQQRVRLGTTTANDLKDFGGTRLYGEKAGKQYNPDLAAKTAERVSEDIAKGEFTIDPNFAKLLEESQKKKGKKSQTRNQLKVATPVKSSDESKWQRGLPIDASENNDIRYQPRAKSDLELMQEFILQAQTPNLSLDSLAEFVQKHMADLSSQGKTTNTFHPRPNQQELAIIRNEIDAFIQRYGAIEKGEKAARDVSVPLSTDGENRVRRWIRTVEEAESMPDYMVDEVERAIASKDPHFAATYQVIDDKDAIEQARHDLFGNGSRSNPDVGPQAAAQALINKFHSGEVVTKYDIAKAELLLIEASKVGDTATAIKLIAEVSAAGTRAGQVVQAMRLLKKMNSAGQLYYLTRVVDNLNREIRTKWGKGKFTTINLNRDMVDAVLSASTAEERDNAMENILQSIADQLPVSLADKWNAWRYLSMLGNPRTHVRNITGNLFFMPLITSKNVKSAIGENIAQAFGLIDKSQRTKSLANIMGGGARFILRTPQFFQRDSKVAANRAKGRRGFGNAYHQFALDDFESMKDILRGTGKYNLKDEVLSRRKVFRSKNLHINRYHLGSFLQGVSDFNSRALDTEDVWFLRKHYAEAMSGLLRARGIDLAKATEETLSEARQYATQEALKATYRDFSAAANYLNQGRKVKGLNIVIEGLLPFKKTPINIAKRGILEYSPIGLLKALSIDTAKVIKGDAHIEFSPGSWTASVKRSSSLYREGGDFTFKYDGTNWKLGSNVVGLDTFGIEVDGDVQKGDWFTVSLSRNNGTSYIDKICSGLTGSEVAAIGFLLGRLGILTGGAGDDDDDEELQTAMGHQTYAIEIGGVSYTIDWMTPNILPLAIGAELANINGEEGLSFGAFVDVLALMSSPIFNLSMLDGLNNVLTYSGYGNGEALGNAVVELLFSYAGQAVPTFAGQIARTFFDDRRRSTYIDKNSNAPTIIQRFIQSTVQAKTPVWESEKMEYHDVWGRADVTKNLALRFFENFLSPGYIKTINTSPMEEELMRLGEATGESGVYPTTMVKKFSYETVEGEGDDAIEVKHELLLTADQYETASAVKGQTAYEQLTALVNSEAYAAMSDAEKVEAVELAYEYAYELAKMSVAEDYTPNSKVMRIAIEAAEERGENPMDILLFNETKTDEGMKKDDTVAALTKTGLSEETQEELMYDAYSYTPEVNPAAERYVAGEITEAELRSELSEQYSSQKNVDKAVYVANFCKTHSTAEPKLEYYDEYKHYADNSSALSGMSIDTYLTYSDKINSFSGENTQASVISYINSLSISNAQKLALWSIKYSSTKNAPESWLY